MSSNDRFFSLVDQGVVSAINFLHIWLVAKYSNSEVLAQYILIYGAGFLLLRIHAAVITMPLAISSKESLVSFNSVLSRYHGFNLLFLFLALLFNLIATYGIVLWFNLSESIFNFMTIPVILAFNVSFEYVRRTLLNYYSKWVGVFFNLIYGTLLVGGVAYSLYTFGRDIHIDKLFLGFGLSVIFSNIIWFVLIYFNGLKLSSLKSCSAHFLKESGVIFNNLSQWAAGQGIYYILMFFSGAGSVALLAVLRNLFGPLNVVLLSLEGFLPKMFAASYVSGGVSLLSAKVIKEVYIIALLSTLLLLVALVFGEKVISVLYSEEYASHIEILMIISFVFIYFFAFISRIILCALRAMGIANISGLISILGLAVLMLVAIITIKSGGAAAAAVSMLVSEFFMASLFVVMFRRKIFRKS